MPKTTSLKFTRTIAAPPTEVARMFTHATALRDWLCNAAQSDARAGGRIYLWWEDGYAVTGAFTKFEPGRRLAFAWSSPMEPAATRVSVTFKTKGDGTQVTVTHSGFGGGAKWKDSLTGLREAWQSSLENLQAVVETGIDLRFARRPRLGIGFDEFTAALAHTLGVPVNAGVLITGTAEGTGARAAGLQKDDVLIALNGKKLTGPASFGPALHGLKAGDKPRVVFYRGAQKHTVLLELSSWPTPTIPATGPELAAAVRPMYAEVRGHLAQAVEGLTEEQAARRPAQNEWSAKELIAHFILCERDYQGWLADMLNDIEVDDSLQMRPNADARIRATVSRFDSVPRLLEELALAAEETARMVEFLPASFPRYRKHLYQRAAQWLTEFTAGHWSDEHSEQMRQTVAAARG